MINFHAVPAKFKFKCIWQCWNSHPEGEADQCCSLYVHMYKWEGDFCVWLLLPVLLLALVLLLQMMYAQPQSKPTKPLFFGFRKSSGYKLQTMLYIQSGIISRNLDWMFLCCLKNNFLFGWQLYCKPCFWEGKETLACNKYWKSLLTLHKWREYTQVWECSYLKTFFWFFRC